MYYEGGVRQERKRDFPSTPARVLSIDYERSVSTARHCVATARRVRRSVQQLQLTTKLTLAAMVSTLLCAAMILWITLATLQSAAARQEQEKLNSNLRVAWHLLREQGPSLRLVGGRLQAGAMVIDGDNTIVDRVQGLVGGVATVFRGTTRVSTNIRSADGTRATGTALAPGPVYDAVIRRHERYEGRADVLGQPYVAIYDPIFSPERDLIGILFVGEAVEDFDASLHVTRDRILVGALAAIGIVGVGFSLLAGRMFRPLRCLTDAMAGLAGRNLSIDVPGVRRHDEIGGMARAVQVFKESTIRLSVQDVELRRATMRFEAALSNMSQGLCLYDGAGRLEVFNPQFCNIFGIDPDKMRRGLSLREVLRLSQAGQACSDSDFEDLIAERQTLIARRESGAVMQTLEQGRQVSIMHQSMPNGGWVSTYEDVTDRRAADAQIAYMARHDGLTGLLNRPVLHERIEQAMLDARRGIVSAILCLDLDHFKRINDTLGHPVGDGLLKGVSARLVGCVRETDTVVRLGGDEFAIVQHDIKRPEDARLLAERVIAAIAAPFVIDGHDITVGASIGLALMPNDGDDPDALLKSADIALYRAKTDERGTFCFFQPEMHARLQRRRQLELDLRNGLVNQEFELFYQPLVSLATEEVNGFEALLRWRHPDRGMVSPAEFIPVAEDIGLIVPLGEWVIRRACLDAAAWAGTLKVAVNLSPAQFRSQSLLPAVAQALADSGLAAGRLELEVTERLLLENSESTLAMLHQLRAMGPRIAMDDFGTGYSSLSYLRSFPFDKIKIDQSFIRDLSRREESIHVVRAVQVLCNGLGMTTTAEGVETEDQFTKLRAEGCTEVQGFLFSPPRPVAEVPSIVEQVRRRRSDRAVARVSGHADATV